MKTPTASSVHCLLRRPVAARPAPPPAVLPAPPTRQQTARAFSVLNRPPPNYPGHLPLTRIERAALALGSGVLSLANPYRGDLIAVCGEATATPYFIHRLHRAMLASATGRRILRDRPRITSSSLDLPRLRALPPNTVGGTYGEVAIKAFEFANTLLPMTGFALLAVATLKKSERQRFWSVYGPWALRNGLRSDEVINIYWEEEMETDVQELRQRLGIEQPPDLRDIRKREREERRKRKQGWRARQ
ncbi:ubiquinone biosynthesis protein coq-4 [Apiospora hydei]|uniref:Ubiquinone biosynthesis protein coq-4 n=1 Tax=Apiospora hydei TaxID=1337664 RepID=A0ABR1VUH7_9PEZI